jgi:hypothetical protein
MSATVRNQLLGLGTLWGIVLAAVLVLVMARPYRLSGFLVAALAAASCCLGALAAVRQSGGTLLSSLGTGRCQGLVGGACAAAQIWALMAVTLAGFTRENPVDVAQLASPRVFLGSFFVALSVFVYSAAGGLLLGPHFGTFVSRAAGARALRRKEGR